MDWMAKALEIAEQGRFTTQPNPMVGCVIVKNNQIVGSGAHMEFGGHHAESIALSQARDEAQDADVYVNLEPCSHFGNTPPCVDALIRAKVKSVHVATLDPNPLINGQGVEKLRQSGIEVIVGKHQEQAYQLNEVFFHYIIHKKPFVSAKWAMSLDGKIATSQGVSQWITGHQARDHAHELRRRVGGIMVGAGTIRKDNPQLTVRHQPTDSHPRPILITNSGHIPHHSHALKPERNPLIIVSEQSSQEFLRFLKNQELKYYPLASSHGQIPISLVLEILAHEKISSLLIEGGSYLLTEFVKQQEIQRLYVYIAPNIMGGRKSMSPIQGPDLDNLSMTWNFSFKRTIPLGEDLCLVAEPSSPPMPLHSIFRI